MGPASLPPLQRAHGMDRQAGNGREFSLREAGGLAERLELGAKRAGIAAFHGPHLTPGCVRASRAETTSGVGTILDM